MSWSKSPRTAPVFSLRAHQNDSDVQDGGQVASLIHGQTPRAMREKEEQWSPRAAIKKMRLNLPLQSLGNRDADTPPLSVRRHLHSYDRLKMLMNMPLGERPPDGSVTHRENVKKAQERKLYAMVRRDPHTYYDEEKSRQMYKMSRDQARYFKESLQSATRSRMDAPAPNLLQGGSTRSNSPLPNLSGNPEEMVMYKDLILIRHAQSVWNAVLDVGKDNPDFKGEEEKPVEKKKESKSLFGKIVDKGISVGKKVGQAASHSEAFLRKNDHALSAYGVEQCFQLRDQFEKARQTKESGMPSPEVEWIDSVDFWMVSPFLRALETSALSLVPLVENNPHAKMKVFPLAREIYKRRESRDCVGKDQNWGPRMLARAISSVSKSYEARNFEPDHLWKSIDMFRKYDIELCKQRWWSENLESDIEIRNRIDTCMAKIFSLPASQASRPVGIVGHSLLFRRILQLYWPREASKASYLADALRCNFEIPMDRIRAVQFQPQAISPSRYCPDSLEVLKLQNCCVLRIRLKYKLLLVNGVKKIDGSSIEIEDGQFLFNTGWEQHGYDKGTTTPEMSSASGRSDFMNYTSSTTGANSNPYPNNGRAAPAPPPPPPPKQNSDPFAGIPDLL